MIAEVLEEKVSAGYFQNVDARRVPVRILRQDAPASSDCRGQMSHDHRVRRRRRHAALRPGG